MGLITTNKTTASDNSIQPTKPYQAYVSVTTTTALSYYTVVNITSGVGILNYVRMFGSNSSYPNSNFYIRITVDGTQYVIHPNPSIMSCGFYNQSSYTCTNTLQHMCNIAFKTSLKVEVMVNATISIDATVDYALV
jgi:hypothetical protein